MRKIIIILACSIGNRGTHQFNVLFEREIKMRTQIVKLVLFFAAVSIPLGVSMGEIAGETAATSDNTTIYVDDDSSSDPGPQDSAVSDPNEDGTQEHPFDMIQEGVDAAKDGDTVVVLSGTYLETINFKGKSIKVTGSDPGSSDGIQPYPIIDGNNQGPVVTFSQGEDPNTELSCFTITGGLNSMGSAILCVGSHPMILNCLVVGNRTSDPNFGATVYCMDSNSIIENCAIVDNYGAELGTSIYLIDCDVLISNSIIRDDAPEQITVESGNDPIVVYSNVQGGWPGTGNIDADPIFASPGYWADSKDPNLLPVEPDNANAVWISGDYHLMSKAGRWDPVALSWVKDENMSPCVDAGDPNSICYNEPETNGKIINSGAYGGTIQASMSSELCNLTISSIYGGSVIKPGEGTFAYDTNTPVAVEATSDEHYYFRRWTGTAVDAGKVENVNSASTTVTVDADYTLVAYFAFVNYTITTSSTDGGSVTNPGEGTFTYGGNLLIDIEATADEHYHFVKWTGSAISGKPVNVYDPDTCIIVDGNYDLVAHFAIDTHTLTTTSTCGGCVVVPGEETKEYPYGEVVHLVAMPYWGYHFVCWIGPVEHPFWWCTNVTITEDTEVKAVFAPNWPPGPPQ
jgi:hypothetical protein